MEIIKSFFGLLTARERRNLYLLFIAVLVMAGLQVVSVASIMPFLSVAAEPASVHKNEYLRWAFKTFRFSDTTNFLIVLGFGALAALILSNAFIVLTRWMLLRYVWGLNHEFSCRLLRSYLGKPYSYFVKRNSSELSKNILQEVREVTAQMLRPMLEGVAMCIVAVSIIGFLIFVQPLVSVIAGVVIGASYAGIYFAIEKKLYRVGEERVKTNSSRYKFVSEAFGGIKEVKLRGKEDAFLDQYRYPSQQYAHVQALYRIIRKAPKYVIEAIAFGGVIMIAVYLLMIEEGIRQVIPMLGLYAFAGYRLMPALQKAFRGLTSARFNLAALKELDRDMHSDEKYGKALNIFNDSTPVVKNERVTLQKYITLDDVYFRYPGADQDAVRDLSLRVTAQSTVGFVGKTGSGKTTTVDIILGLFEPTKGTLRVDDTVIDESNVDRWQNNIGYVPQQIFLSDDTIARNIAFGVPENEIDMKAVRDAAQRAHIHDFVERKLPNRWSTVVGERGIKLSGGQRQRIGIARALYHGPSVLVFDEATSALDQSTEESVMEAIYDLDADHTILIIAHRLSTVRRADKIVMLEDGCKVGEGEYDELAQRHSKFRSMVHS